MASSNSSRQIADQAVALATDSGYDGDRAGARAALIKAAGDEAGPLEQARAVLVRRIRQRSDDFSATSGLSLLNGTLSQLGWQDDVAWKPKQWRIPH